MGWDWADISLSLSLNIYNCFSLNIIIAFRTYVIKNQIFFDYYRFQRIIKLISDPWENSDPSLFKIRRGAEQHIQIRNLGTPQKSFFWVARPLRGGAGVKAEQLRKKIFLTILQSLLSVYKVVVCCNIWQKIWLF